ncbi:hypothetical protein SAMN05428947_10227 [Mucilaginibacter sp. OK283]|nr:hypothetical protein SAMN05428947_10227 [Mucilaginibacter sp. OK283]
MYFVFQSSFKLTKMKILKAILSEDRVIKIGLVLAALFGM